MPSSNMAILVMVIFFWNLCNRFYSHISDRRQNYLSRNFTNRTRISYRKKKPRTKRKRKVDIKTTVVLLICIRIVRFKTKTIEAICLKFLLKISFSRSINLTVFPFGYERYIRRLRQYPNLSPMYYEGNRLFSFVRAPIYDSFTTRLASLGFYYVEELNITKCAFCGAEYSAGNNLADIHHHECTLEHDNIPLRYTDQEASIIASPKFTEFESLENREASFHRWPYLEDGSLPTSLHLELAKAGFFYTGHGDIVRCFSCGGCLRHWKQSENHPIPWIEHLCWFPHCDEVKRYHLNQHIEWIEVINRRVQTEEVPQEEVAQRSFRQQIRRSNVSNTLQTRNQLHETFAEQPSMSSFSDLGDHQTQRPQTEQNASISEYLLLRNHDEEEQDITPPEGERHEEGQLSTRFSGVLDRTNILRHMEGNAENYPITIGQLNRSRWTVEGSQNTDGGKNHMQAPNKTSVGAKNRIAVTMKDETRTRIKVANQETPASETDVQQVMIQPGDDRDYSVFEREQHRPALRSMVEDSGIPLKRPEYVAYEPLNWRTRTFDLSQVGYYNTGEADIVRCFCCDLGLAEWDAEDDPWVEHARHSSKCDFLQREKGADYIDEIQLSGRKIYNPKHLDMEDRNSRLETFNDAWRTDIIQTPEILADAGFFYTGDDDIVRCHYCDGGLRNWEPSNIPWEDHARWFPFCKYVIKMKGREYVEEIRVKQETKERDEEITKPTKEIRRLQDENKQMKCSYICVICMEQKRSITFLPCGHILCCIDCAYQHKFKKCMLCGMKITKLTKVSL